MKATFNIKTRELVVKGKDIDTLKVFIDKDEVEDYWDSVSDKKTGEPKFDVNIYFDDFANDGGNENNPNNYKAQYVNLIKKNDNYEIGQDYKSLPLKVTTGEFNPMKPTFIVKDKKGNTILKTKRLNKASDISVFNEGSTLTAIDDFGFTKILK